MVKYMVKDAYALAASLSVLAEVRRERGGLVVRWLRGGGVHGVPVLIQEFPDHDGDSPRLRRRSCSRLDLLLAPLALQVCLLLQL